MHHQSISLPISHTTEYGFGFIKMIALDDRFRHTPMWCEAPIAPVVLSHDDGQLCWKVVRCPYCAREHVHGIDPGEDPRLFLGGRCSHCQPRVPDDPQGLSEYRLVAIAGDPTSEGIERYFPMYWDTGPLGDPEKRTQPSQRMKSKVWRKSMGHCWYCGDEIDPFSDFEVDHFLSLKNGGTNHHTNLVPACRSCNAKKSHWHVEVFRTRHFCGRLFWFECNGKEDAGWF